MAQIIPVPAVNGAIFNNEGQILITRRSPTVREPGKWCLPGGHFDGGEDWVAAMRREVLEEVGLTVVSESLLGVYSDPDLTITDVLSPENIRKQFVTIVFVVREFSGEVRPNDEVDEWGWFNLSGLPAPMVRSHPIRIEDAFSYKGTVFVR